MKYEKPLTQNIKDRASSVLDFLHSNRRFCTLALSKNDLELVEHAWKETDKRVQELESMKSCFVKFHEKMRCSNG